jgi:hypothetical protein
VTLGLRVSCGSHGFSVLRDSSALLMKQQKKFVMKQRENFASGKKSGKLQIKPRIYILLTHSTKISRRLI